MLKQRINWVDNFKGFLIILVVLGHVIQYSCDLYDYSHLYNYIYSFHMPAFMALSGYVSYKSNNEFVMNVEGIKRRAMHLLIPYLVWTIFYCLLSDSSLWKSLFVSPVYWFLLILFIINNLMVLSQSISYKLNCRIELMCLVITIILFAFQLFLKPKVLSLNILHVHYFFYVLGWILHKNEKKLLYDNMFIPLGILFAILGFYYTRFMTPSFMYFIPLSIYFLMSGSIGTLFFILLFRKIANKKIPLLSNTGRKTLGIYVIHIIFCVCFSDYFYFLVAKLGFFVGILIIFIFNYIISFYATLYIEKFKYIKLIVGGK